MATNSGQLVQALVDGGVKPAAARVIANALANADTPQFSGTRDVQDATPTDQLRMVTSDTRRYLLTNLDYSREAPYQARLQASPGRYESASSDHPYKDSQPVTPVPPLSRASVAGGPYITVEAAVQDGAPEFTVSLKFGLTGGTHLRIKPATSALEAVPLTVTSPQGLVTATVSEQAAATNLELAVRGLSSRAVVLGDGTTAQVLTWADKSTSPSAQTITPTGAVVAFAALLSGVSGWLLCDGSPYSRTAYAALFAAIGTSYGSGDGSTTFNVPDMRGYFVRGLGTNSDGTASGTLGSRQADATKRPTTSLTGSTDTQGAHTHDLLLPRGDATYNQAAGNTVWGNVANRTWTTSSAGSHSHAVTITGGGDAETRPKNIALAYYIKT